MSQNEMYEDINLRDFLRQVVSYWRWLLVGLLVGSSLGALPIFLSSKTSDADIYMSNAMIYIDPEINPYADANMSTIIRNDMIMDELKRQHPVEFDLATELTPGIIEKKSPGTLSLMVRSTDAIVSKLLVNTWANIVMDWLRDGILAEDLLANSLEITHTADLNLYNYMEQNSLGDVAYCDVTYIIGVDPCPAYVPNDKTLGIDLNPEVKAELSGLVLRKQASRENSLAQIAQNNAANILIDHQLFLYAKATEPINESVSLAGNAIERILPVAGGFAGLIITLCVLLFVDWWKNGV